MKYYFTDIKIKSGEYEFNQNPVHEIDTDKISVESYFDNYLSTFYSCGNEEDRVEKDKYGYYTDGFLSWRLKRQEEITEQEYNVLKKFI